MTNEDDPRIIVAGLLRKIAHSQREIARILRQLAGDLCEVAGELESAADNVGKLSPPR